MSAVWYLKRISRMSPVEIGYRARDQALIALWRYRRRSLRVPLAPPRHALRLDLPETAATMATLAAKRALLQAADVLLEGEWTLFGAPVAGFDAAIDWFRDPQTGRRAYERTYCFDVPYRDETAIGNVKFLWETSRLHHLTVLATAYRLSGEEKYAARVAEHLNSWWEANPFLTGVNWASGIEVGLRLITWVWLRRLLAGWGGAKALFERNGIFIAQLYRHQQYLAALRSHGSSANNHLIAEAAGLFIASTAFPIFQRSPQWRRDAARVLEREIGRQIDSQGLSRELATDYHGFVLELLLVAAIEADAANAPLSEAFWGRIQSMMDALAAIVDATGRPPRQGDSDDGTALLLDSPRYDRWRSLLATGARLFGAPRWWPQTPGGDIRTAFLTSIATARPHLGNRPSSRSALFTDAGLVILRDTTPGRPELWCRCDHGKHGFLSIAAHAHADALAIELRHGGVDILADPGTYCYHGEARWRRYFRSTLGHNTLELGGLDQAVSGGAFLWLTHPVARVAQITGLEDGPLAIWIASHDGYVKPLGAVHHRSVSLDRGDGRLIVQDWIEADRAQDGRLALHLGPAVTCRHEDATAWLAWNVDGQDFSGRLDLPKELTWTAHRGDDIAGWYSPKFAQKVPSTALIGSGQLTPSHRYVTAFISAAADAPRRHHKEFSA